MTVLPKETVLKKEKKLSDVSEFLLCHIKKNSCSPSLVELVMRFYGWRLTIRPDFFSLRRHHIIVVGFEVTITIVHRGMRKRENYLCPFHFAATRNVSVLGIKLQKSPSYFFIV